MNCTQSNFEFFDLADKIKPNFTIFEFFDNFKTAEICFREFFYSIIYLHILTTPFI